MVKSTKTKTTTELVEEILEDKRVKRLFKSKDSGVYAVDTSELMRELEDLMQTRKYRDIKINEFLASAQKKSIDWLLELTQKRSRAVHIKMTIFKTNRLLTEQLKNTKGYILNTYSAEIGAKHTSISARTGFVDHLLEPMHKIAYKFDSVLMMADILIADLDQGYWACKAAIDAMKISHTKDA